AKLLRHRLGRARGSTKNRPPPSAFRDSLGELAAWAGQRNLRSSPTRARKSSGSMVSSSVAMRKDKRRDRFVIPPQRTKHRQNPKSQTPEKPQAPITK